MLDLFKKSKHLTEDDRAAVKQADNGSMEYARRSAGVLSSVIASMKELDKLLSGPLVEFDDAMHTKVKFQHASCLHENKCLVMLYSSDGAVCAWFE